ncbi:MAG: sugar ABC transporter ATP-binding protein [Clostridiales Family XIII bacterium]|jgi:ribose transport system ATP-binding protein|nr:sugar ABC transporter ATP-binding protein [Clostridiales Family XIII bacterium]
MEDVILDVRGVSKSFGKNRVLTNITMEVKRGEVHAIVGENGAGKSTLIKALAGEYPIDGGEFILNGQPLVKKSVKDIQTLGLQVIHQNLNLVPSMTVLQNILMGDIPVNRANVVSWHTGREKALETLRMVSDKLELDTPVEELSAAEKQLVIIARAIINEPTLLVLDEPTARLGMEETQSVFRLIDKLKSNNVTMLYITHRLEEIYKICDRVSVFRDGEKVLTSAVSGITQSEMASAMLGKKVTDVIAENRGAVSADTLLEIKGLQYKNTVKNISFEIKRGEIVGLIGSVGAGKSETLDMIFGSVQPDQGEVFLNGEKLTGKDHQPVKAVQKGIAYIPEDRQTQGLVQDFAIRENLSFADIKSLSKHGAIIDRKKEKEAVDGLMEKLLVKPPDPEYKTSQLSGGNQQKVLIGKWLVNKYELYLMDEVTAGVDIGAKMQIYEIITDIADSGSAVLLATSDITEALYLCNRFVILHRGEVIKELDRADAEIEDILLAMMGGGNDEK